MIHGGITLKQAWGYQPFTFETYKYFNPMPRNLSFVCFGDLGGKRGDNFLSHTRYICITCMNFPDVNTVLCVTLLICVFCLLLWILSLLLQQKEEDVCG